MSLNNMSNGLPQKKQISIPVFVITILVLIIIFTVTLVLVILNYEKTMDDLSASQVVDITNLPPMQSNNEEVEDISTYINAVKASGNYTIVNSNSTTE